MRKTLKILLLAVMLLVMVGMTMVVASAAEDGPFEVATVNGESTTSHGTFATFADAMAAVKSNGANTIKVLKSVTLSETLYIDAPVTIDGQGNTITFPVDFYGDSTNWKHAVELATTGEATLKNIVIDVLGGRRTEGDKTIWDYVAAIGVKSTGTLTLYDAEVKGGYHGIRHEQAGKIVIDGANSKIGLTHHSNFWVVYAPGTLELRNGLIDTTNNASDSFNIPAGGKGAHFKMSGGTFKSGADALYSGNAYNITVTGGLIWAKGNAVNPAGDGCKVNLSNCEIRAGGDAGSNNVAMLNVRGGKNTLFVIENVKMSGGYIKVQSGATATFKGANTSVTMMHQITLDASSTLNIEGGSFTAAKGYYLIDLNSSGSLLNITGGSFTAPADTTLSLIRLNDTGSTIQISGGDFVLNSSTNIYVIDKNNGKMIIDWTRDAKGNIVMKDGKKVGPTFRNGGIGGVLDVQETTAASYTTIKGGYFISTGTSSDANVLLVVNKIANTMTIEDGVFSAETGKTNLSSISLNASGATLNITGGEFMVKNNAYGMRFYGSAGANYNVSGGWFSYREKSGCYNADGTLKSDLYTDNSTTNVRDNEYGLDSCSNGIFFFNSAANITFTGGTVMGGVSNKVFRLNRADNLVFDGDVAIYGYRTFDYTMSSGKVCVTVYDGTFQTQPGHGNNIFVTSQGTPADANIAGSFIKVYGGDFGARKSVYPYFDVLYAYQVILGGSYVKGGKTYQSNVTLNSAGSNGHIVKLSSKAAGAKVTFGAGLTVNVTGSGNILEMNVAGNVVVDGATLTNTTSSSGLWMNSGTLTMNSGYIATVGCAINATGGTVTLSGGTVGSRANNTPMSFTGSSNLTVNDGFFQTYLDNITSPSQINFNATSLPLRDGVAGLSDFAKLKANYLKEKNEDGSAKYTDSQAASQAEGQLRRTSGVAINTTGAVVINGGVFQNGDANMTLNITSKVTINGGTFTGYRALRLQANADVTIEGGNFYGAAGWINVHLINIYGAGAKLTINGGNFDISHNAINGFQDGAGMFVVEKASTIVINGGNFIGDVYGVPTGAAMFNLKDAANVTVNGGTFVADGEGCNMFIAGTGTIAVQGGTFELQNGAPIAQTLAGVTFASNPTFIIGAGTALPAETITGYNGQYKNANWEIHSWDAFEVSTVVDATNLADIYAACGAYVASVLAGTYKDIVPGTNCTVTISEWVPLTVVAGGVLTLNMTEALTVNGTLVTIAGGKVIVAGGTYVGDDFGDSVEGLFNISGGELLIQGGSFTMTNGGSIVFVTATSTVTIQNGTFDISVEGHRYDAGSVLRIGNDSKNVLGTYTILGGTFNAARFVTVYAINSSDGTTKGDAIEGAAINVLGGTFNAVGNSSVRTDNKYLFQVARPGHHTITVKDVTVNATQWQVAFMANASGNGAIFNIENVTVNGGLSWIYVNRLDVTVNVKDSTFVSTDASAGYDYAMICLANYNSHMTFENTTFSAQADTALFRLNTDNTASVTLNNVKATVQKLLYVGAKDVTTGVLNVVDALLIVKGADEVIFDLAGTVITKAVVVSGACTVMGTSTLNEYSAQVMNGGEYYYAWVKGIATKAEFAVESIGGAAIDVSSNAIASNPELGGIRFSTTVPTTVAEALKAAYPGATFVFGTVIAPAEYVAAAGEFTMAALDKLGKDVAYVDIPAVDTVVDQNYDGIPESFSGALISLKSYTRSYAGVAYVKVIVGETVVDTFYGAYNSAENARSAQQVASAMIADGNSAYHNVYSDAQKAVVDAYASGNKAFQ